VKFGQVWEIENPLGGSIVVMLIAESPHLPGSGVMSSIVIEGSTYFAGGAGYAPGRYGPGDIGPVKFGDGELVDDEEP